MLFHSWQFLLFFFIVFTLYWQLDRVRQNWLLLIASSIFYGWWDWRFLGLIWLTIVVNYLSALLIDRAQTGRVRQFWLVMALVISLSPLFIFKYYDFFATSLTRLATTFGWPLEPHLLSLILPVGISFFTFQTLSYTIDVYRRDLPAAKSLRDFALFITFFPQLVAGPIERAGNLLPQFTKTRHLTKERINKGLWLFFFGLWLKVFVANGLAPITNTVFSASQPSALLTMIGAWSFSWQIFADFAGYSTMARGLGQLLGIDLMINFNNPFFSQNVRELWQRWHISLSSWVQDYVYIPLGGSRRGFLRGLINLIITMTLMGLWHGSNVTFIVWGLYFGLIGALYRVWQRFRLSPAIVAVFNRLTNYHIWLANVIITFNIFAFGMIVFRSQSMSQAWHLISALTYWPLHLGAVERSLGVALIGRTLVLLILSYWSYRQSDPEAAQRLPNLVKAPLVAFMIYGLLFYSQAQSSFIYFAF